jgi:hypothetical protein
VCPSCYKLRKKSGLFTLVINVAGKVPKDIIKIENSEISGFRIFCGLVGSLCSKPVFLQLA